MTRIRRCTVAVLAASAAALAGATTVRAAAPAATTGPATAVGATTATVTGSVVPGGRSTTWYVEYGTSTSYGAKTAVTSVGSGTASVGVTSKLADLDAGTTYHYRLVAANVDGTSRGGDAVFTTLVPPAVVTGAATRIGTDSATLTGTVDPNGRAGTYYFEYGSSTSYGSRTPTRSAGSGTSAQSVSAAVSGLQVGRTYHFRLVAATDAGTSSGRDATFTTSGPPGVSTADATRIGTTNATLRGTVDPNGLSTTWWFEYGRSTAYGSRTGAHGAGSGTAERSVSLALGRLSVATTYHFRLVAQNASGRRYGADRTFSTAGPPAVQTEPAQAVGFDTVQLMGALDARGRAATWWFEYGTSSKYGSTTTQRNAVSTSGAQTVGAVVGGLTPGVTYHYRLVAKSDGGTTYGPDATVTTQTVSVAVTAREVVFGGRIRLSGVVPTRGAGEQVVVFAQAFGAGSPRSVATVVTGPGGTWSYLARPPIGTTYQASWRNGLSATVVVGVHPRIGLGRLPNGHLVIRVTARRSFAHRVVQLQRRVRSHWVTVKRVRLGKRSRVELRAVLPRGRSTVRAAFSVNQAGPGFLGGASRALTLTRR
jgi:hypothetical protein